MATTGTLNTYGDVSPRTAGYASKRFLERGQFNIITEQFLDNEPLPSNSTRTIKLRRYNPLARALAPLAEGIPPAGSRLTYADIQVTLEEFGDFVQITDVIEDTHEDPVLRLSTDICSQQATETLETVRFGVLKAGTNVYYANGAARSSVNTVFTKAQLNLIERAILKQRGKYYTEVVKASRDVGTVPVPKAFICLCHTDLAADIRNMTGFVEVSKYAAQTAPFNGEIGAVGNFRFITTPLCEPWTDAGGAKGAMLSTTGTSADVYPVIVLSPHAAALVPLKGKSGVQMKIVNPGAPSKSDPLGQKGSVGWKTYHACLILNDNWMARVETAATAAPT